MTKHLMIAAGGTGGHIFPALAVAQTLKQKGVEINWLGVRGRMEEKIVPKHFPVHYLSMKPLRGKGWQSLVVAPWNLLRATLEARRHLKQAKPDAVLSMGGFVCAPVGLAAKWLKIPLIVHEQNAIAGWTNRLLAPWASKLLEAFPGAFKGAMAQKAQCAGNPIRKDFFAAVKSEDDQFNPNRIRILVLGGSQGARYLNTTVATILADFAQSHAVEIVHQCGAEQVDMVKGRYAGVQSGVTITPFIENMAGAYDWADLVIARSGALTVSEISCKGVASLLVPLPGAVDDHQRYNALFLEQCGAAVIMDQRATTMQDWERTLQTLLDDPMQLQTMGEKAAMGAHRHATERVAEICEACMT